MTKPDWKVCLEIGLNHLGSYPLLEEMLRSSGIKELGAAVTVQIKEEEFYKNNKEYKSQSVIKALVGENDYIFNMLRKNNLHEEKFFNQNISKRIFRQT